jgi:hypothetical protein
MRIDILTLFPEMFQSPLSASIIKRAVEFGLVEIKVHNIRDYTYDQHHTADDYPYGGGAGMVLKPGPVFEAVEAVKEELKDVAGEVPIVLMTPQGRPFSQPVARELSQHTNLVLICGHYDSVAVSPGADDDGSGTVATLVAASIMSKLGISTRNVRVLCRWYPPAGGLGRMAEVKGNCRSAGEEG